MSRLKYLRALCIISTLFLTGTVFASEMVSNQTFSSCPGSQTTESGSGLQYFPSGDLYRPYAADPFRVGFGVQLSSVGRITIPNTSSKRVELRAGGVLGIIRSAPEEKPGEGWQVSLMGGFNDQNDIGHSLDNIGWDGHYGLLYTAAPSKILAYKLGLLHVSSHVGDEYAERTGRRRIGYTRQELAAGISWFATDRWRFYTEAGRAFFLSNRELQQPWRGQLGIEYQSAPRLFKGLASWYGAIDAQSMQEREWRVDVAVQGGLVVHSADRTWRLGLDWYQGRPPIGEFFQYTERYLSLGLWIDI